MEKIFPLNLTSRAATMVTGNPVTTRLEGGVGNCYPGLEFDHRNLDRRFFPGLVFEFGDSIGAPLLRVDISDPIWIRPPLRAFPLMRHPPQFRAHCRPRSTARKAMRSRKDLGCSIRSLKTSGPSPSVTG